MQKALNNIKSKKHGKTGTVGQKRKKVIEILSINNEGEIALDNKSKQAII